MIHTACGSHLSHSTTRCMRAIQFAIYNRSLLCPAIVLPKAQLERKACQSRCSLRLFAACRSLARARFSVPINGERAIYWPGKVTVGGALVTSPAELAIPLHRIVLRLYTTIVARHDVCIAILFVSPNEPSFVSSSTRLSSARAIN